MLKLFEKEKPPRVAVGLATPSLIILKDARIAARDSQQWITSITKLCICTVQVTWLISI